jgi:hypothetical protein
MITNRHLGLSLPIPSNNLSVKIVQNIDRHLDKLVQEHFKKYKEILILLGSRQSGKTTLIQKIFPNALYLLVDNEPIRKMFETYDLNVYKNSIKPVTNEVIIDEIHLLSNPGRAAKIIYDQLPYLKLILTGSSSFHIKNKTSESLAGRKIDYFLHPLTFSEYLHQNGIEDRLNFNIFDRICGDTDKNSWEHFLFDINEILKNVLLYGQYPNLLNHPQDKTYLINFVDSLIFKDIIELNLIESRRVALNLLKLLAYQIGNLINYSEIANKLQADQRTVKRYIEIFEMSYIIYRLYPFSGNRRDEIVKSPKIYFYDTGIRNAIINNFSDLDYRPDKGAIFENFIITECIKANSYLQSGWSFYFWRTKQKTEIDLVLEKEQKIIGGEIKFKKSAKNKSFINTYPKAVLKSINLENFYR